jgi:hypothetical protein
MVHVYNPSYVGGQGRMISVEHLPSKREAPSSKSTTTTKKEINNK